MTPDATPAVDPDARDLDVRVRPVEDLAAAAAAHVAAALVEAVAARRSCTVAFSGGSTPDAMLRELGSMDLPWTHVHVLQVDERVAPAGSPDRNLTMLLDRLGGLVPTGNVHPMPVEGDLDRAATAYEAVLRAVAGVPPRIDVVHLGLGSDGHTASLVPDDPVTDVTGRDVAPTGSVHQGHRRLTLTFPVLARARSLLWLVAGAEKAGALRRLVAGDTSIPAGRVRRDTAVVFTDDVAAQAPR